MNTAPRSTLTAPPPTTAPAAAVRLTLTISPVLAELLEDDATLRTPGGRPQGLPAVLDDILGAWIESVSPESIDCFSPYGRDGLVHTAEISRAR